MTTGSEDIISGVAWTVSNWKKIVGIKDVGFENAPVYLAELSCGHYQEVNLIWGVRITEAECSQCKHEDQYRNSQNWVDTPKNS